MSVRLLLGLMVVWATVVVGRADAEVDDGITKSRAFNMRYRAILPIEKGTGVVDLWLPIPYNSGDQRITNLKVLSPFPYQLNTEPEYGNQMVHVRVVDPQGTVLSVELRFDVWRRAINLESIVNDDGFGNPSERYVKPDVLVPVGGRFDRIARLAAKGRTEPISRGRGLYEFVLRDMSYDKSVDGYGRGDANRACDIKKGNCTDFHSYFISLARSLAIPARFEMGFPLPFSRGEGKLKGYHCWAWFFVSGRGWVPVDISEADKNPELAKFYFGGLDESRVGLVIGRDIKLEPPQQGSRLNYFIYPYGEVDGKVVPVEWEARYTDLAKK